MRRMKESKKKMKELILYISEKCADDRFFGATKLNKILFLSDFWAYAEFGRPITGMEYMKLRHGPAPRKLLPIRREMERGRELAIQEGRLSDLPQMRPVNLRPANLSLFTAEEIALVDMVIEKLRGATAAATSRYTHRWSGWQIADENETIPYPTVFLSDDPISEVEIQRGMELNRRHRWDA